jgi:hypothetical protein
MIPENSHLQGMKSRAVFVVAAIILAVPASTMSQEVSTGFDVRQHGFAFPNQNWGQICYSLSDLTELRYDPHGTFCSGGWGLCGGMSLAAGERFLKGLKSIQLTQAEAKADIVDGQFRTLDSGTVTKFLDWISAPNVGHTFDPSHSIGYRMKEDWSNSIKPTLSGHEPLVLGLIFDERARFIDLRQVGALAVLTSQHQVLGIGFKQTGLQVEIEAYDPDYPMDQLSLTFTLAKAGVAQRLLSGTHLTRKSPRGVLYVRRPARPGAVPAPAPPCGRCCEWDEKGHCKRCIGLNQRCP